MINKKTNYSLGNSYRLAEVYLNQCGYNAYSPLNNRNRRNSVASVITADILNTRAMSRRDSRLKKGLTT